MGGGMAFLSATYPSRMGSTERGCGGTCSRLMTRRCRGGAVTMSMKNMSNGPSSASSGQSKYAGDTEGSRADINGSEVNGTEVNGTEVNLKGTNGTEVNVAELKGVNGTELVVAEVNGTDVGSAELGGVEVNIKSVPSMSRKGNGRIAASPSAIMRYMNELHPRIGYLEPRARHSILKALVLADLAHKGQKRKSGEPFIIHPVAVTVILADLRLDRDTLIAGLLHDTVEDTPVTFEELEDLFGTDVRKIVEGETKFSKLASKVHKSVQSTNQQGAAKTHEHESAFGKDVHALTPLEFGALMIDHTEEEVDKQAEYLRNMFLAMTEDVRVIIVKLADRLHNMRTLQFMTAKKQKKIAAETLDFFAPLAHRLGMARIKCELEDLSFKYLYPEEYETLRVRVDKHLKRSKHEYYLKQAQETLRNLLLEDEVLKPRMKSLEVERTTKPLYSIYQKIRRGESLETMVDLSTLVVIIGINSDDGDRAKQAAFEKNACYHFLGRIHALYQPLPGRFKDYIAFPKPNGYQSLHTTVFQGPTERFAPLDIHIRTKAMHQVAEEGITIDAFSNEPGSADLLPDSNWRERIMLWLRSIREYCHEFSDSSRDLVDAVRYDLLGNRVFVFTPRGRIVDLPRDSTPVDVAYRVHSEVGNFMVGSLVNGRTVSLDYKLQNADLVEILTDSRSTGPSPEWLEFAKTRTARSKIRKVLRERERGSQLEVGRRILCEAARTRLEPVPSEVGLQEILASLQASVGGGRLKTVDELYVALAVGGKLDDGRELELVILDLCRERRARVFRDARAKSLDAKPSNDTSEKVHIATCCRPLRGDTIRAVREHKDGPVLSVHRDHCTYLKGVMQEAPETLVEIDWDSIKEPKLFPIQVVIEASDHDGLLAAVSGCITKRGKSILKSASSSYSTGYATLAYEFLVEDVDAFEDVLEALRGLDAIDSVRRKGDPSSTVESTDDATVDEKARSLLDEETWTEEL